MYRHCDRMPRLGGLTVQMLSSVPSNATERTVEARALLIDKAYRMMTKLVNSGNRWYDIVRHSGYVVDRSSHPSLLLLSKYLRSLVHFHRDGLLELER